MALSKHAIDLKEFITKYIRYVNFDEGEEYPRHLEFPEFDLTPFDYLNYAEKELSIAQNENKINCVGHLKRAVDCELDTLLQVLNIYKLVKKRNLGFSKKLELVHEFGIFRLRSLEKLNTLRNKMEHKYDVPDNQDLEIYFDLAYAFILALEGYMFMLSAKSEVFFSSNNDKEFQNGVIGCTYNFDAPSITYALEKGSDKKEIIFTTSNIEDFAFALKVLFLLIRATVLVDWKTIAEELGK